MPDKYLCLLFGVPPSARFGIVRKMLSRVVKWLSYHPCVQVKFPNEEKMQQFIMMVQAREHSVPDVIFLN